MTELRIDPVSGHQVLVAPARGARPHTTRPDTTRPQADTGAAAGACPFCPGHEGETPPEAARTGPGEPGTPGWRTRVFPNKFPIVGGPDPGPGAGGIHEVLVLSPDHDRDLAQLTDADAVEVFTILRDRSRAHADACAHVGVFVNHGHEAGASIAHPHAQIVGLTFVPDAVVAMTARSSAAGADLVAVDLAAARAAGTVVVDAPAPAWCPLGATAPYEVRVAPAHNQPGPAATRFDLASDDAVAAVSISTRSVLAALRAHLGPHAYNVVVHTSPTAPGAAPGGRSTWFVAIIPRLGVVAGFEIGTGVLVNTVAPESAAADLRSVLP